MTIYAYSSSFPISAGYPISSRPNIKITRKAPFNPYQGTNLGLLSISPVNNLEDLCALDYVPVTIILGNLGENDYDFAKDVVSLHLEVTDPTDPQEVKHSATVPLYTGYLISGKTDKIELMQALPIMLAGEYELKAWLESSIDNIVYDDTLFYTYISGRISLPLDEDFSANVLPYQLMTTSIVGLDVWTPYSDSSSVIQPNFGTGMLRYAGAIGTMAQLSTHQLNIQGTVNPEMKFWYYHDTAASMMDNSYTEVNIVVDDIPINVLTLFRKDVSHGWKEYSVKLSP
jgi:hypothetical protein